MTQDHRSECSKTYSKPILRKGPVLSKVVAATAAVSNTVTKAPI